MHNIHSAGWPIGLIRSCSETLSVSWTLHDCWSFLGSYYPKHTTAAPKNLKGNWMLSGDFSIQIDSNYTLKVDAKKEAAISHWSSSKITVIRNPIPRNFPEYKKANACKEPLVSKQISQPFW